MKFQKQYSDIYGKIQNNTEVDLPESLQPAAIADLVKGKEIAPRKRHIGRFASLAAAVVLVLAGVIGWRVLYSAPKPSKPVELPQQAAVADADDIYLRSAADYGEIEAYFAARQAEYKAQNRSYVLKDFADSILYGGVKNMTEEAAVGGTSASGSLNGSADDAVVTDGTDLHGETNTQVAGVDEGDILKNDGKYLYLVRQADPARVEILDIRDPQAVTRAAEIQLPADNDRAQISPSEIYVYENTLVVLANVYEQKAESDAVSREIYLVSDAASRTLTAVYDISDRTAPVLLNTCAVDGSLLSSRMNGKTLVLLTTYFVPMYPNDTALKNACVPCYYQDGQKVRFPAGDVKLPENTDDTSYLTVSVLDTEHPAQTPKVKAVLGGGENVYCGTDTLLVAYTDRQIIEKTVGDVVSAEYSDASTRLFAFSLSDTVCYKGSAQVAGTVLNQFSMDAYNGFYRIATTDTDGSCITVLNTNLEAVGTLSGLAKDEYIYAARFMGDTAYLVTFLQTDPLFVVDLSNPEAPALKGELKIPGFSSYLHPYGENLLIGVGRAGTESGATQRVKISLFDVSDKENPKEISKIVYGNNQTYSDSAALNDHKAYLSFADGDAFAVPIHEYNNYGVGSAYMSMLTVENGELKIIGTFTPAPTESDGKFTRFTDDILRMTYSGDTVYTLSDSALTAFSRDSGEILCTYALETQEAVK